VKTEELITVTEAARRLSIRPNTFYKHICAGRLDGVVQHFYGRTNVDWPKLLRYMAAGKFDVKKKVKQTAADA
jgi:hypothetical protein